MQCSMTIAALAIFGAETKIAYTLNFVLFTKAYSFPCKKCFPTIYKTNYTGWERTGHMLCIVDTSLSV